MPPTFTLEAELDKATTRTSIVPVVAWLLLASVTVTLVTPPVSVVRRAVLLVSTAMLATAVFDESHVYGNVPPDPVNVKPVPGASNPEDGVMASVVGAGVTAAVTVTVTLPVTLSASVALTVVWPAINPVNNPVAVLIEPVPLVTVAQVYGARPPDALNCKVEPTGTLRLGAVGVMVRNRMDPVDTAALVASRKVMVVVPGTALVRFALVPAPTTVIAALDVVHV